MKDAEPTLVPPNEIAPSVLSTQTWISATFILVFTTLGSKLLGVIREVLVANYFGTSAQVDAFAVASTLAALVGGVGSALATTLVPAYRRALVVEGPNGAKRLTGGALALVLALVALAIALLVSFPLTFVHLVAPDLPKPTALLAAELVRWLVGLMVGINIIYVLSAVYNALEHFKIPSLMDLASNPFVLLALVLLSSTLGIRALAVGLGLGTLVVGLAMAVPLFVHGVVAGNFNLRSPGVREMGMLAIPVYLWEVTSQGGGIVENFFAATLEPGSIAALGYAKRLSVVIVSLLAINIARAVFPILSRLITEDKLNEAKDLLLKLSRQYVIAFVPVSLGMMFFRHELVQTVFMRGAFDAAAAVKTSAVLFYYSVGILFLAAIPICARACYAFADTAIPLAANLGSLVAMAGFNYILTPRLGVAGVALSTSLSLGFSVAIMGASLRRRLGGLELGELGKVSGLAFVCGVAALGPVSGLSLLLPRGQAAGLLGLVLALLVYLTSYLGLGWFVMRREVRALWSLLRNEL